MNLKTKTVSIILFFIFSTVTSAQNDCAKLKACERKLCELKTELEYAKEHGNPNKIKGIEDAIYYAEKNCTTNKVYSNLDKKIKEKEEKIKEIDENLTNAIRDQKKTSKIEKIKRKLDRAKTKLNEAILTKETK